MQSRNEKTSDGSVVGMTDRSYGLDVATLGEGEADLLDSSEDSVDGMATIADSGSNDNRFFGIEPHLGFLSVC